MLLVVERGAIELVARTALSLVLWVFAPIEVTAASAAACTGDEDWEYVTSVLLPDGQVVRFTEPANLYIDGGTMADLDTVIDLAAELECKERHLLVGAGAQRRRAQGPRACGPFHQPRGVPAALT